MGLYKLLSPHIRFWQITLSLVAALFTIGGSLWAAHHWTELQAQVRDLSVSLKAAHEQSKNTDRKDAIPQTSPALQTNPPAAQIPPSTDLHPPAREIQKPIASAPEDLPENGKYELPAQFKRQIVSFQSNEPTGTLVIDASNTFLYLVLGNGQAMRYGIGVGRGGLSWSGTEHISKMAEWPDWRPTKAMRERQPYLPEFMAGGEGNPLGARALYLGNTLHRIHGTNQPTTIGRFGAPGGSVKLTNEDIADLYSRVRVGARVVALP